MGRIKKEGQLVKSPPESKMKKESSWHKRYFVLAEIGKEDGSPAGKKRAPTRSIATVGCYLMYWESYQERKKGKKPLDIIGISSWCSVQSIGVGYFPQMIENLIELRTPKRRYVFSADSQEIMEEWTQCLNEAVSCQIHDPIYERINDSILDFIQLLNQERAEKDVDTNSCSSTETETDLRRSSDAERCSSFHDDTVINHYEKMTGNIAPKSMRSISLYNLPEFQLPPCITTKEISLPTNDQEQERFYHDIKLICPSHTQFELSEDDVLEVHIGRATYTLVKKEHENTQL